MPRARVLSIIVVLILANYLVFSNVVLLLVTAGSEAATRVTATRVPRPTATALPIEPTPTVIVIPTVTATPTIAPTAGPTTAVTPTPTRSASSLAACAANAPFKF